MKKFLSLILVLSVLSTLSACSPASETPSAQPAETTAPTSEAPVSHYPVTVTDQAGREVTIEDQPEKLVSGYYISTSLMIALGMEDDLVGIEAKADKRPIYKLSAPQLIDLPNVGTAKEFDLEGCAALEPDLVILPLKLKDAAASLEKLGIDVLLVNPENTQLLNEMIGIIAKATDTEERAAQLMDYASENMDALAASLEDAQTPSVYLAGNSSMLSTAGGAMYQSDMISLAGGDNVAAGIEDNYWAEIDYEQLLTWDPEYIILASDATYTADDVIADPNLADCTAVSNKNVFKLPSVAEAWDSPVPSSFLGSWWLASVLHPDLVSADDCSAMIDEYYETFYDFTYSEN